MKTADRKTKPRTRRSKQPRERIITDAPKLLETFEPGDVSHQGDLIVFAVGPRHPADKLAPNHRFGRPKQRVARPVPKLLETFEPGDVSHQGDLIVVAVKSLPASARPRANRQLADGATQGSRHVLERGDVYDADAAEVSQLILDATGSLVGPSYVGPVFVSPRAPTEHDLTHPEHGHQGFPAGAICAVVYQRNLDAERREARVLD